MQKRFDDQAKLDRKVTEKALKESLRRARETVQVGPLYNENLIPQEKL